MDEKNPRRIAGFFRQLLILFWKNWVIFKRSTRGMFAEVLMTLLFVFILVVLRYFTDVTGFSDQNSLTNPPKNVIDNFLPDKNKNLILYYPNNNFVRDLVRNAILAVSQNVTLNVVGSDISDAKNLNDSTLLILVALISFPANYTSSLPNNIQYNIYTQELAKYQYNVDAQFYSKSDFMYTNSPQYYCTNNKYYYLYSTLFNVIKYAIDMNIIQTITNVAMNDSQQVKILQFNCPAYENDVFKTSFAFFPQILVQMAFIFTLIVNLGNMVVEKQNKMKEYLRLMGIKWYTMWITSFLRSLIPYTLLSLLLSIVCSIKMSPRLSSDAFTTYVNKAVFGNTNFFVIFSAFFVYSVQVSLFTQLISHIFSKPFVAKISILIIWIITAINFYNSSSNGLKYILSFFPNIALNFVFQVIFQFERSGYSLSYSNLYSNIYGSTVNVGGILGIQIFWTLFYLPLNWYIEKIFPGEYGAPLPFYFPFMPSYWCENNQSVEDIEFDKIKKEDYGFEKEPALDATISIQKITKKFKTGFKEKTVVNDMSINFYENQITGLLGHNGAGKTTTTFMLCGIYAPTSGNAYVLGHSVRTQMDQIRSSLGFCPQHDILYDDLTVSEHIKLIALIKGYSYKEIANEITVISKLVGLEDHLEKRAKQLSGGMKRRLSVAMAITGDSRIIILDEPTSGLDPFNRRSLWELIRKFKPGRTILLTTHFMEEADALSDRIAIMNHGQVKCCGSPVFLKNTFGSGYRLTLSKNNDFDEEKFKNILNTFIEKNTIETNIAAEMCVSIPFSSVSVLPQFLSQIEEKKSEIGIEGYGISSPTIEEVFIKIGSIDINDENTEEDKNQFLGEDNLKNAFGKDFVRNHGIFLIFQQLKGFFIKRFYIFIRRYILAALILLLPLIAEGVLSAIIPSQSTTINSLRGTVSSNAANNLSLTNYGNQIIPYYITGASSSPSFQTLLNSYISGLSQNGINMTLLSNDSVNDYVLAKRKADLNDFLYNYFVGLKINVTSATKIYMTLYYSTLAYHSSASILNEVDNLILKFVANDNSKSIITYNSPVASNSSASNTTNFLELLACLDSLPITLLNFLNALIIAFIISIMIMHVARERTNGSKQLQILSGAHYITYWVSNYLFDLLTCLFNIVSMVIILKIVDSIKNDSTSEINPIAGNDSLGYFFLLLLFSCFSWCTLAYIWSFFFKSDIIALIVSLILLSVIAFIDVILTFLQILFQNSNTTSVNPAASFISAVRIILALIFPNVTVKRGLYDLKIRSNAYCISSVNSVLLTNYNYNEPGISFNEPGIGMLLLFSVIQFFVGNIILIVLEKKLFSSISCCRCKKSYVEQDSSTTNKLESDVLKEADRINSSDLDTLADSEPLVVSKLVKRFYKGKEEFLAVDSLSFGIANSECFGLLGLNGAGKTTTFKILTGEIRATSGKAFINGTDIDKDRFKARLSLGFCPQFDYLPEYLTVEETFRLFSELRGLDGKSIKPVVNDLLQVFKLGEFKDKLVQNLSGGNKRKVSAAIAFIGRPSLIILDEPTTGMDPAARKYLWTVINRARELGLTIILTTHSMEECEALSTKLGIMVNGQFKCFGSVQHLKDKYGKGYTLVVKCKNSNEGTDHVEKVDSFVTNNINFSLLKEKQQETLFYQIEYDDSMNKESEDEKKQLQSISELFKIIESNKDSLNVETYSLSQTTLEQVFLLFARLQKSQDDLRGSGGGGSDSGK